MFRNILSSKKNLFSFIHLPKEWILISLTCQIYFKIFKKKSITFFFFSIGSIKVSINILAGNIIDEIEFGRKKNEKKLFYKYFISMLKERDHKWYDFLVKVGKFPEIESHLQSKMFQQHSFFYFNRFISLAFYFYPHQIKIEKKCLKVFPIYLESLCI